MGLQVKRTGVEQWLPGGEARMKILVIGGPGAGKTRWSSYWPKAIYADCEGGLASVADRNVPYAEINGSKDMLDFLEYVKRDSQRPEPQYDTVVIDTLDAFHRKVKDEWMADHPNEAAFSGFDAWGYLDAKMSMLMTRLLNLKTNVIVLVHYKDKTVSERVEGSNTKTETTVHELLLQGSSKDTVFNDFDLVGWMGTYWEADPDEGRVLRRGLTFIPTPEKPFLKDRLNITPRWLPVEFSEKDYERLFATYLDRLDELKPGEVMEEIEEFSGDRPVKGDGVVGDLTGGPVPPQEPRSIPFNKRDKPSLVELAKSIPELANRVRGNTLKSELIDWLTTHFGAPFEPAAPPPAPDAPTDVVEAQEQTPVEKLSDQEEPDKPDTPEAPTEEVMPAVQQPEEQPATPEPSSSPTPAEQTPVQTAPVAESPAGTPYDPASGEVLTPEQVAERLGAEVVSEEAPADPPATSQPAAPAPQAAPAPSEDAEKRVCAHCQKDLSSENADLVRLSFIKYRKTFCNEDYGKAKRGEIKVA